jgi:hypothetical protein
VAAIWVLAVLAIVSGFSAVAVIRTASTRKQLDLSRNRLQANWLAKSGYEIAVGRLLANPDGYTGETVQLIAGGEVKIVIKKGLSKKADEKKKDDAKKDADDTGIFRVECEGRYPTGPQVVVISSRRVLKRVDGPQGARIEAIPGSE